MANDPLEVVVDGPIFDGSAARIMDDFGDQLTRDIAESGVRLIKDDLEAHIKHGTGHYVSNVGAKVVGGQTLITDNGVIYGPWLEGTSSRNESTHFKGYSSFRRSVRAIQEQSTAIANRSMPDALRRLS